MLDWRTPPHWGRTLFFACCLLPSCSLEREVEDGERMAEGGANGELPDTFLDTDLSGDLPSRLSALGLYPDMERRDVPHDRAHRYEPRYPLWTNGSEKQRFAVLPAETTIDVEQRPWGFPVGALFFKTFSYQDVPIETRVLRLTDGGWEFDVYLWNEDATEAELLAGLVPTEVAVTKEGETFTHEVPSTLQCRTCHESAPDPVLGFDELRLNGPLQEGGRPQLQDLANEGVLSRSITEAERIAAPDELTARVFGYFSGNCVHCHNGGEGPSSAFSLRHDVAWDNTVDVASTSELVSGIRVLPGDPENSGLFLAMSRVEDDARAQPMPPVGVQRRDDEALELLRQWISQLGVGDNEGMGGAGGALQ